MFITNTLLAQHPRLAGHRAELVAHRNIFRTNTEAMIAANRAHLTGDLLAANALAGMSREYWAQVDAQIIDMRDQEPGIEILNDLLGVQTVLDIGKTASLYNIQGDIADDVAVSIDGQAPYSFDHTDFDNEGDPVPVFTAGFGVNWRHQRGLATVGIDLVLRSQESKQRKFSKKLVSYLLDGDARIVVAGMPGQGLRNHRHTFKVNLGAGGANIDLVTATPEQLIAFFSSGSFAQAMRQNKVRRYSKLWLSSEIMANLSRPYLVTLGTNGATVTGRVLDAISPFIAADSIEESPVLSGNEYLAYVRRRDVVSPLVGMATGVVPLPRFMPQDNYNFQIMGAMGLKVALTADGNSGVQYGADLT